MMRQKINILIAEDNECDVLLVEKAFEKINANITIYNAPDGEEALKMLARQNGYDDIPRPDLILLDINMPKKDGFQVLQALKKDRTLSSIPVLMMTGSSAQKDIEKSYDLYAAAYIVKPTGFNNLCDAVSSIERYWFDIAVLSNKQKED